MKGDSMEKDLFHIIREKMELSEVQITDYSPLTLAYIGDGIYEVIIRTLIIDEANRQVNKIHKAASRLVKAETQAKMIRLIMDDLTEEAGTECKSRYQSEKCFHVGLQNCHRF